MSLTQHLQRPGPIRAWWAQRAPRLRPYVDQVARVASGNSVQLSVGGAAHAAAVGGIVGRHIETLVEPAPPYAAIAAGGYRRDACAWPTHEHLHGTDVEAFAVEYRPTPAGLRRLVPSADRGTHSVELQQVAHVETTSMDPTELAEAAAIVTALESAYRAGARVVEPVSALAVQDAVRVMRQLGRTVEAAARLCGGELRGHAAPVFAAHWADGDVLLGPGASGYGLFDVKTVGPTTLRNVGRITGWLAQLLSYTACDAGEDLWRVRAVGLILPRQDALLTWPVAQLWAELGDRFELAELLHTAYLRDSGGI